MEHFIFCTVLTKIFLRWNRREWALTKKILLEDHTNFQTDSNTDAVKILKSALSETALRYECGSKIFL